MKFEREIANTPIVKKSAFGYQLWGKKNQWPTQILDLYSQSPTLRACVNFAVKALVGRGVDYTAMGLDGSQLVPNYRYSWDELIRRCAEDYFILGGFALQVIKNRDNVSYSIFHQPMETVRYGIPDEDGVVTEYWLCSDWSATGKNPPIRIPSLTMRDDGSWNIKAGEPFLFVPEFFSPLSFTYPLPCWSSALKAVQSECAMMSFDLKTASNVFCPAGALSLPPAESDEAKNAILKNIQSMFSGADGAQQLLITFRNDSEDSPISFTPFQASSENVDLFSTSNERSSDRILSTFSIASRSLIGLPMGNVGFSSEGEILREAFQLYMTLSGADSQRAVISVMNQCFKANGIDVEIIMKPLVFGTPTTQTDTEGPNTNISEDNVQEQKGV